MAHDTPRYPKPEFDVVMITHNKIELTIEALKALYLHTDMPFHLIIIDDSTDLTPQYLDSFVKEHDNVTLLRPDKVRDGNHCWQLGIDNAVTDIIVTHTNSSRVEPEWYKIPLQIIQNDGRIGLVGIKLLNMNGLIWHAGIAFFNSLPSHVGIGESAHRHTHVTSVSAVNFSIGFFRKQALANALDFDTYIPWRSFDDTDTCLTLLKNGWGIIYCGLSTAYHVESPTRLQGDQMKFWEEYNENLRRFLAKWLDRGCLN